jgi:hypothetical protein
MRTPDRRPKESRRPTPEVSHSADAIEAILQALLDAPDGVVSRDKIDAMVCGVYAGSISQREARKRLWRHVRNLEDAGILRRAVDDEVDNEMWTALVLLSTPAAERVLERLAGLQDRRQWWVAMGVVRSTGRWDDHRRRQMD